GARGGGQRGGTGGAGGRGRRRGLGGGGGGRHGGCLQFCGGGARGFEGDRGRGDGGGVDRLGREHDDRLGPVVGGGAQGHLQVVPLGDGGDHDQTQLGVLAHVGEVETAGGAAEQLVGLGVALGEHAQAPVLDLQGVAAVGQGLAAHRHRGV